jgi:hypothetical protein
MRWPKALTKRTDGGLPVHGFRPLRGDAATVTHNTMAIAYEPDTTFVIYPQSTPTQARAFELLDVSAKPLPVDTTAKIPIRESDQRVASRRQVNFV